MDTPFKKVLLFNYYWPPSGGPAVQRWVDFVRLLLQEQVQVTVVTIDQNVATYPLTDKSLENKIPSEIDVHKTDTSELFWLYKKITGKKAVQPVGLSSKKKEGFKQQLAKFVRGNLFIPDPRKGWTSHAIKKGKELLKKEHYDCIITAGPPHSTHLIGLQLKKEVGIKWIADFHDEWTSHWVLKQFYRTSFANKIDRNFETQVVKNADIVLSHCQAAEALIKKRITHRSEIIYMGYDDELFKQEPLIQTDRTFRVVYTGTIGKSYHPEYFFKAFKRIADLNANISIKFVFAGAMASEVQASVKETGIAQFMEDLGYVSHEKAIELIQSANLLLLMNPIFEGEKRTLPGKLFEYLATKIPILNVASPDGQSAQIIEECDAGQSFAHQDEEAIYTFLNHQLEQWKANDYLTTKNKTNVSHFSRQNAAKQLKEIIYSI